VTAGPERVTERTLWPIAATTKWSEQVRPWRDLSSDANPVP
jgi:hypothetical protein